MADQKIAAGPALEPPPAILTAVALCAQETVATISGRVSSGHNTKTCEEWCHWINGEVARQPELHPNCPMGPCMQAPQREKPVQSASKRGCVQPRRRCMPCPLARSLRSQIVTSLFIFAHFPRHQNIFPFLSKEPFYCLRLLIYID